MKIVVELEIGEIAYIADVLDGRHPASFWADQTRVNLVDRLNDAKRKALRGPNGENRGSRIVAVR